MSYSPDEIILLLKSKLTINRFLHSMGVAACAKELAIRFNCDESKAYIAGILHDCSTQYNGEEMLNIAKEAGFEVTLEEHNNPVSLLHARLSAYVAERDYGIKDKDVLQAIAFHSSGGIDMTRLDKIVGLADAIEPSRKGKEIDRIRALAEINLDEAYLEKYSLYMINTIQSRTPLSIVKTTVYNYLLVERS